MVPAERYIRPELYQHEKDKKLISEIMNHPWTEKILRWLQEKHIDEIYNYVYQSSCVRLTEQNSPRVMHALKLACRTLGYTDVLDIYLIHDYNRSIEICGIGKPFFLISSHYLKLLERESQQMLTGILAAQVGAVCVGHHKGLLLVWAMELVLQQMSIPKAAAAALEALLNDWKRCRVYTCDRIFFAVTKNYQLSIRSIFLTMLPAEILDSFRFGTQGDLYREQMERFLHTDGLDSLVNLYNSASTDQAWMPLRYKELEDFANRTGLLHR